MNAKIALFSSALKTSARMAIVMGICLPILEVVRRSNQISELQYFMHWFDDFIIGGVLIFVGFKALKGNSGSILNLVIVWSMAVGVLVMSFLYQLNLYLGDDKEPGVFSKHLVALVKGLLVAYTIIGLTKSIKALRGN